LQSFLKFKAVVQIAKLLEYWVVIATIAIFGSKSMRLLLVEDNEQLGQLLARSLRLLGYSVDYLTAVAPAREALMRTSYAALILDLGLPDGDGLSIIKELRSRQDTIPVLVISGRGGQRDRVSSLRSGADDYLVKPFALQELAARLEKQLRRPGHLFGSLLQIANLKFDIQARLASINGQPLVLSAREAAVLECLMRNKGRVVSKRLVEQELFGLSTDVVSNAIEVYVHRLRKQLSDNGARVRIHTMRGLGYLMSDEEVLRSRTVANFKLTACGRQTI
jgi:two-component system response regulator TctD